jgi:hypothetical protein
MISDKISIVKPSFIVLDKERHDSSKSSPKKKSSESDLPQLPQPPQPQITKDKILLICSETNEKKSNGTSRLRMDAEDTNKRQDASRDR